MSTNDVNGPVEANQLDSELRYVEGEELEKTWKNMRRERHKLQENNIWQHFCGDQDVLTTVSSDDPYQFIEDIPEWQLQQLIQIEVEKVAQVTQRLHHKVIEEEEIGDGLPQSMSLAITDNDDETKAEATDDYEHVTETMKSPLATVRECVSEQLIEEVTAHEQPPAEPIANNEQKESTVYCNKIKELRDKIHCSILNTICCLENYNFENIYSEDIVKMKKHSTEFCVRFNRVYLYQIQRQICDLKRHDSHSLPFAKYTHFQAQMLRVTSLHQNILNAFNILNKTYADSLMVGDTMNQLKILINNMRETTELSVKITEPVDVKIVHDLYNDDVMSSCNTLEERLMEYEQNLKDMFHNTFQSISIKQQINIKKSHKPDFQSGYAVNSFKADNRARATKSSIAKTVSNANLKENKSCKIKKGPTPQPAKSQSLSSQSKETEKNASKSIKKNPSCRYSRRPLMSSRGSRSPTSKRHAHTDDIQTLVENIDTQSKKSTPRTFRSSNTERSKKVHSSSRRADEVAAIRERGPKATEPVDASNVCQSEKVADATQNKSAAGGELIDILRMLGNKENTSAKTIRAANAKNVQLVSVKCVSPRPLTTVPEQLKILDEKIEKKYPKEVSTEKHLLTMSPTAELQQHMEAYRAHYIQHMLKSPLYANINFNKPWELVARVSDNMIDELVSACTQEMQLLSQVNNLYKSEIL